MVLSGKICHLNSVIIALTDLIYYFLVLQEPVRFPTRLSENSKRILNGLLEKAPEQRFHFFSLNVIIILQKNNLNNKTKNKNNL